MRLEVGVPEVLANWEICGTVAFALLEFSAVVMIPI